MCGALARSPAFGKPPSRYAAVREKRFAVSLVPFWLRAHKVKGKVEAFLKRKRVRPADVPQKTLRSLRSAHGAHVHRWFAQARRSAASLACRLGRS